jgi:PAS domain S-box-containing protein
LNISSSSAIGASDADDSDALRFLVEGTVRGAGEEFFRALVRELARAVDVAHCLLAEFVDDSKVRTLAYWRDGSFSENFEYDLAGTPCEDVLRGDLCHHPAGVSRRFPRDLAIVEMGIESYLGVPLTAPDGMKLGHLCVFDTRPMPPHPKRLLLFRLFADRVVAELDRLRMERELAASEQRYRDLFEEAPIAYVHEGLDSKFISANRAAQRILGIRPDEVAGTVGMSFVPDTPEAQARVRAAFESIGRGDDASGVVLELRRRDDGKAVFIQWWSKPDPGGAFTRTMFLDITDMVLMEREKSRLSAQNAYLQEEIKSLHNFEEIVGASPALLETIEKVERVAPTDATVLISGETGTGKELIARAVHSTGRRKDKPLIKLNCAALPAGLVESELFGHEKGAFSGAVARRIGRFELANGGTIFLDEIGELPLEAQAKLLRVLQEREFERVGGSVAVKVDVRVIAATNRDLPGAVRGGTFREDLFYRLNVFPIALPPLRDRAGDIPALVQHLVRKFASRIGVRIESISEETMWLLAAYSWPGNVRELENVLERAVILSNGPVLEIDRDVLPSRGQAAGASSESSPESDSAERLESVERRHILDVLKRTRWVIEGPHGAARILDLHPNTLRSRMKRFGIVRAAESTT